jgi:hypothetical protein
VAEHVYGEVEATRRWIATMRAYLAELHQKIHVVESVPARTRWRVDLHERAVTERLEPPTRQPS